MTIHLEDVGRKLINDRAVSTQKNKQENKTVRVQANGTTVQEEAEAKVAVDAPTGPIVHLSRTQSKEDEQGALYSANGALENMFSAGTQDAIQRLKTQITSGNFVVYSEQVADGLLRAVHHLVKR